jgi:type II secretory pathway component PulJ
MRKHFQRRAGYNLMELLTYMAVFAMVMGVVFPAFHKVFKQFRAMERNTDDIVRVMNAGERWRNDVRASVSAPVATDTTLKLVQKTGTVTYEFADNAVWRTAPDGARWAVLSNVKSVVVHEEKRSNVTAWRWEVELLTKQDVVRVTPLFSFMAVAGGGTP